MCVGTYLTFAHAVGQLDAERWNNPGIVHIGVPVAVPSDVKRWVTTHIRWHTSAQLIFVERSSG